MSLLSVLVPACQEVSKPPPVVTALEPNTISSPTERPATISGDHFYCEVRVDIGSQDPPVFDRGFEAIIGETRLVGEEVTFVDPQTLDITIPAELPAGFHHLTVITPGGQSATLENALAVDRCRDDADCDDGLYCNGVDTCDEGACVHAGNPCTGGPQCADSCDELNGTCNLPDGRPCSDDGDPCTTSERCESGECLSGPFDKDGDGDGYVDVACAGNDCDDDPAGCGADCSPGQAEGPGTNPNCSDNQDNDCDGFTDQDDMDCHGAYAYRKQITVDHTGISQSCLADLSDYPLLVLIENDPDLRDAANGGQVVHDSGWDISFLARDGNTRLDHQVEFYDGASGTLVAWVRIPMLSITSDTIIYLHYGSNQISAPTENPSQVWVANYIAVLHLNNTSGGVDAIRDSTIYGNHATDFGNPVPETGGLIGPAIDFDGIDNYATMGTNGFNPAGGTAEAWVSLDSFPESGAMEYVFSLRTNTAGFVENRAYIKVHGDERWGTGMGDTMNLVRGSILNSDTWYHLAITWDGVNVRGYNNGILDFGPTPYFDLNTTNDVIYLMAWNIQEEMIDGTLDELRVSDRPRSECWIETGYHGQSDPSSFYLVGAEEPL